MVDRILYNGAITTLYARQPFAEAIAIRDNRVWALGSSERMMRLANAETQMDNLDGNAVIPGLTDAHIHLELLARNLQAINLYEVPSKAEALRRIKVQANETPADTWLTGQGWTQELWPEVDYAFPSAADLDPITGDRPAYFASKSIHAGWANSAALRAAGITAATDDPAGGQIVRDASGQPTGMLLEEAMYLVLKAIPAPTPDELADDIAYAQDLALSTGLTGLHDFDNPSCMRALQILRERGELSLRVHKQINRSWLDHALALGIRSGFGDDWLRFGSLKLFADGALGPRTALMVEPYEHEPDNYGIAVTDKETMLALVSKASAGGLASTIHAIGDRAVHDVLDIFETVRKEEAARGETPTQRRHRIEHVQLIHPDDKHRLAELDIIASMQPIHATSDYERADKFWGERAQWSYNTRLQLDQGVRVAFGSDAPVEPFRPLEGIYSAVTRRRPDGSPGPDGWYPELRLTIDEALRGYTQGPAYAAGMENRLGMLAPGYLADLVVLDKDLTTIHPDEIVSTNVIGTMVDGEWRYGGAG
jgi:predicted amidohydrolase YtcJ